MMPMKRQALLAVLLTIVATSTLAKRGDGPPSAAGSDLYKQFCSACHDHPQGRIPPRDAIARRTPEEVMRALTNGLMRTQAAGLNMNDRVAVATFVTGKPPNRGAGMAPEKNLCGKSAGAATDAGPNWNGWGRDLANTRYQPEPGLTAAQVPHLKVKWAFGYQATYIYGQPTVVGGRVYATSSAGRVYSLDATTGCVHWTFDAASGARAAVSIARIGEGSNERLAAIFGDDSAFVYAVDATSGQLIWKRRLDPHPDARITGAPVFYQQTLYVPVSSLEELSAPTPGYECCKFRGSMAALNLRDGKVLWQTYTIDQPARPYRKTAQGTQLYGPAGASIWSAPTLDPNNDLLYVGTGNSYTDVTAERTDSILALSMSTGAIRWVNQLRMQDNYIVGCETPESAGQGNCPQTLGPDVDFGTSPILRTLPGGHEVLLTGQKSGRVYGLDPKTGKQLWAGQVGVGGALGGIEWGSAADASQMYLAVSDAAAKSTSPGGLVALRIDNGQQVWRAEPPKPQCSWGARNCITAQSQAVSAIPGVVFSGSHDGHLRAYAAVDGKVLWDFDTAQSFDTVNGIPGAGGSLDNGGATIAGGLLFVNSGYGRIIGQPGNVLIAFGVD